MTHRKGHPDAILLKESYAPDTNDDEPMAGAPDQGDREKACGDDRDGWPRAYGEAWHPIPYPPR